MREMDRHDASTRGSSGEPDPVVLLLPPVRRVEAAPRVDRTTVLIPHTRRSHEPVHRLRCRPSWHTTIAPKPAHQPMLLLTPLSDPPSAAAPAPATRHDRPVERKDVTRS